MQRTSQNPVRKPKKAAKSTAAPLRIHATMSVAEVISLLPEAGPVLAEYGLHCFNCSANTMETLADGYMSHGFAENELDDLVRDLNHLLKNKPERPRTLSVTKDAALALGQIAKSEGKEDQALQVGTDEVGAFCLEFRSQPEADSLIFFHREVPNVRLLATPETLQRIGGATIDLREGRFKLDLPEVESGVCACGGNCSCSK